MNKATLLTLNAFPIILMIGLIPLLRNDFLLTAIYIDYRVGFGG